MAATASESMRASLRPQKGGEQIRLWLLVVIALVYAMILVGGATRLTDSGLSITEWKPVTGAIPPLSDAHWAEEFKKYRQDTAEYRLQNAGMSLDEFKYIYFWEWGHRLLGRLIGVVFLIPFIMFWASGRTTPALRPRLWLLFGLGGLQGAIGWWMVASGVGDTNRTDVAAYRLMTHFSLALLIISIGFWYWLQLGRAYRFSYDRAARGWALLLLALISLQMMLGALVAGLDAGRTYVDWPLMDSDFVPRGYWGEGGLLNLFENVATTQFNHRMLAYIIAALSLVAAIRLRSYVGGGFTWLCFLIFGQIALGVVTLVHAAPVSLGLMHQALGAIVLLMSVYLVWKCSAHWSSGASDNALPSSGAISNA